MSSSISTLQPGDLLVCYWQGDEGLRTQLDKHLAHLIHDGLIAGCVHQPIPGGSQSGDQRSDMLDRVQVVLFLLSPRFLDAAGGAEHLVQRAIQRHQTHGARAFSILLHPVDYVDTPFDSFPVLPNNGVPVTEWSKVEDALVDVATGIREAIKPNPKGGDATFSSPTSDHRAPADGEGHRDWIGRYRVEKVLGQGAFGRVYLARDDELGRSVAIKTPHLDRITHPGDLKAYLSEARILASLDHPGLVPVYDVGHTDDGLCYVVSKLIVGTDLRAQIERSCPAHIDSAKMVAAVADALAYAHAHDVVHRDIKPANILIDTEGIPYVADFGLAIKDEDFGGGTEYAGTPSYMSPEQARGEGHRVDGRSDIFSLGVVFYELLTGRRPFRDRSVSALLDKIANTEARPPRQINAKIPRELERICLKAMANRVLDRYSTAKDFADDLRHFVAQPLSRGQSEDSGHVGTEPPAEDEPSRRVGSSTHAPGSTRVTEKTHPPEPPRARVIPKGLRAFDARDAEFFFQLLPGARDRNGIPESIRFWKNRIEETKTDETFSVGLIYGPSGCGKTSFVQAGLVPCLPESVVPIYVESVPGQTETRLGNLVAKHCPGLPGNASLSECLALVRRGQGLPRNKKLLVILDQFEHWMHATPDEDRIELLDAIRQSDGERVQTILMVRADFWMGASRCMRKLEIFPREGDNSIAVDLFDQLHARKVLAEFGQSLGRLPEDASLATKEHERFLDDAVSGLAESGKVIPVRLALFADMIRGREWTRATLKAIGGMEGVGVTFLEETFHGATAPPEHRRHERAARRVLRDLLPDEGTDLRVRLRSDAHLLEASGYANRREDFSELLRILDTELRLITPTEREDADADDIDTTAKAPSERYYQLTHDYLVPSIREWLTRKQKETIRGRAELRLAERSRWWVSRPENRQLPSMGESVRILCFVPTERWTLPQREMMRKACQYHGFRSFVLLGALCLACLASWRLKVNWDHELGAVAENVLNAEIAKVPALIDTLGDYRPSVNDFFQKAVVDWDPDRELRARLALLPIDAGQISFLDDRLLRANPDEFSVIRDALGDHRSEVTDKFWEELEKLDPDSKGRWFRAACALAAYDPDDTRWKGVGMPVAEQLVSVDQLGFERWVATLRPIQQTLSAPLKEIFRDPERSDWQRRLAAIVLADYLSEQPEELLELLADAAHEEQFEPLLVGLRGHGETAAGLLTSCLDRQLAEGATEGDKEIFAQRRVNVAIALLGMGHEDHVWPLLARANDPRTRSYLIHRFQPLGVDCHILTQRLLSEPIANDQRAALVLALGEFGQDQFESSDRIALADQLLAWYKDEPDPAVHAASAWLLRLWGMARRMEDADQDLKITEQQLAENPVTGNIEWYINGQGHTMIAIPEPVEFRMGSPPGEVGREGGPDGTFEQPHTVHIKRSYAIAAREVTFRQFLKFRSDLTWAKNASRDPHSWSDHFVKPDTQDKCPVIEVSWYDAAEYCNWLSEQESIPLHQWCYLTNQSGEYAHGMKKAPGILQQRGYRLPTEAEWEYACRALTTTSRYYGETDQLLSKYAWYQVNSEERSVLSGGSLKPNDFGLFDMYGNVAEWCDDMPIVYPLAETRDDLGDARLVGGETVEESVLDDNYLRSLRGGGFLYVPSMVRSAARDRNEPHWHYCITGFRVARTVPTSRRSAKEGGPSQ